MTQQELSDELSRLLDEAQESEMDISIFLGELELTKITLISWITENMVVKRLHRDSKEGDK